MNPSNNVEFPIHRQREMIRSTKDLREEWKGRTKKELKAQQPEIAELSDISRKLGLRGGRK